jgi:probable F420-dependent oxidoreductase
MFTAEGALAPPELARAVEAAGFDVVSFPDHTHLPAVTSSIWPSDPGSQPATFYAEIYEVFIALAAAAVATTTITLGAAVCVLPQRDPIITAKQVASIDRLSGGRLRLGIGDGWNAEEMENHGRRFADRLVAMRERVEAMRAIWRDWPAEYHGRTVDFAPILCGPRPVQAGGPPLLIAGESHKAVSRVLRYGDGWMTRGRDLLPRGLVDRVAEFRAECLESGRGALPIVVLETHPHKPENVETYARAGVDEVLFVIRPGDAEAVSADLSRLTELVAAMGLRA